MFPKRMSIMMDHVRFTDKILKCKSLRSLYYMDLHLKANSLSQIKHRKETLYVGRVLSLWYLL